jgi:hypothetical protein
MQWLTAGLIVSAAMLLAGIYYLSLPVILFALITGGIWGALIVVSRGRDWFRPW